MTLGTTPSQTVGPFYAIGLTWPSNELVPPGSAGAVELTGALRDGRGEPIADGMVEVWDAAGGRWGRSGTDADGRFSFVVAKPDAPAGGGAPRLDVYVFARGLLRHQLTRIYFPDEPAANDADPVLSRLDERERQTLVARQQGAVLLFDVTMQGDSATVFFAH